MIKTEKEIHLKACPFCGGSITYPAILKKCDEAIKEYKRNGFLIEYVHIPPEFSKAIDDEFWNIL